MKCENSIFEYIILNNRIAGAVPSQVVQNFIYSNIFLGFSMLNEIKLD